MLQGFHGLTHKRWKGAGLGLVAVAGVAWASSAKADDAAGPDGAPAGAGSTCVLAGEAPLPKGTALYEKASGGAKVAEFTGAILPLSASDLPAKPADGRARLATAAGGGDVRLEGFVEASKLTLYTKQAVPVVPGIVWISAGRRVKFLESKPDEIAVELSVAGSAGKKVKAKGNCSAFALSPKASSPPEPDAGARGLMMRGTHIDFHGEPNGDVVFSLDMMEGAGLLFWSNKVKGPWVEVHARGDLTIDAWAHMKDLAPLHPGEMMDRFGAPVIPPVGASLKLEEKSTLMRATAEIPIRSEPNPDAPNIGTVQSGAEIYLLEKVGAFRNVLPKHLGFLPGDPAGFWIPASVAPEPSDAP